jgi:GxxExxY protein
MNANRRELLLQKEVYTVVGCAIEVLNVRGHGLHDKIYENCLCVEFVCAGFPSLNRSDTRFCTKASW